MQKLVLFGLALLLLSCGRDTGSYSYTGVFVDSCGSKPIENAKVVVHVYDIDSTRSDASGYFKISGNWDEKLGWAQHMPQPSMEITVPRPNSLYDFYGSFHYVPRGQHDFGVISIFNHIILPVKFDTTGLGYNRVKYTIQVRQEGIIPVTDRQTHSFSPQWSPTKSEFHFLLPLQVDTVNRTPSMPIFMSLTFPDGKQTNKPDIDITDLIKLCGPGDTLEIKF